MGAAASLGGSTVFSVLDLASGFFQAAIEPDSIHLTAVCTQTGLYEWLFESAEIVTACLSVVRGGSLFATSFTSLCESVASYSPVI